MFKRMLKIVGREAGYLFFRRFVSWREVRRHYAKRYSPSAPRATNTRKMVVFMADGFRPQSGLADRLRGIVALYGYCRDHNLDFRIHFSHPFNLQKYLQPNVYDWRISPDELCWNSHDARAFHWVTVNNDNRQREVSYQRHTSTPTYAKISSRHTSTPPLTAKTRALPHSSTNFFAPHRP